MHKCAVIAAASQKGGVGKNTTAEHSGIGIAKTGKKVFLIDLDPPGKSQCLFGTAKRGCAGSSFLRGH